MTRHQVSTLFAKGTALERAGRTAEAYEVATQLVRAICAARAMRQDGSTGIRESDVDAIAWAQGVIEQHEQRAPGLAA